MQLLIMVSLLFRPRSVSDGVEVLQENQSQGFDAQSSGLEAEVVGLAGRFYPSETAFPLGPS